MPRKFSKKYVVEDSTGGRLRFYFRKVGQKKVRLPGVPGSDEFNKAYYDALNGVSLTVPVGPKMANQGTFRWLCQQYFQSAEYRHLSGRTQHVRRLIFEHMWAEPIKPGADRLFEDIPLEAFNAKAVRTLRDRKADKREAANSRLKALRAMFSWACASDVEYMSTNPAKDVAFFSQQGDGFHSWTAGEFSQFKNFHPIGTKPHLALALLLYTVQRRSDIVQFGKQHVRDGVIKFTQHKGREKKPITLEIPIHPQLQKVIDATPCGDLTFLVTEFNKGFTAAGFGNWFRTQCDLAGLPHCSAHGVRKGASARLAENGATESQIKALTGHQTLKEVANYTKGASQRRMAQTAILLLDDDESGSDKA